MKRAKIPECEVTFTLTAEFDDTPVKGNVMASGDEEEDRKAEEEVYCRIENQDVWGWAIVTVTGTWCGLTARAGIGACTFKDEDDFIQNSGYYEELKREVRADLQAQADTIARGLGLDFDP